MANGLLDMFMPSEDEAMKRALMAAGFGMMGTRRGNEAQGLGRAGLLGMGVYENSLQNQLKNKTGQFDLASGIAKMQAEQQAARHQQELLDELARGSGSPRSVSGPTAPFRLPGGADALMRRGLENLPYTPALWIWRICLIAPDRRIWKNCRRNWPPKWRRLLTIQWRRNWRWLTRRWQLFRRTGKALISSRRRSSKKKR